MNKSRIRKPVAVKFNILDPLMSADEKIMSVYQQVQELKQMLVEIQQYQTLGYENFQVPFRQDVPVLTRMELDDLCPCTGYITSVIIHWPPGCNSLVGVAACHMGNWLVPSIENQLIALDSATPIFEMRVPCVEKDRLWTVMDNGDAANNHVIQVIFNIEKEPVP